MDYHLLKPTASILFPLTYHKKILQASSETKDNSLVCLHEGPTLYQAQKSELLFYFGEQFVSELDTLEAKIS